MISVSAGYGTEGSRTPTTVGSLLSDVDQKRYVSTTAPAAFGPSSLGFSRRPSTGRRPMTSKNEPPTTPALTMRGSPPSPTIAKSTVEKSPNPLMVVTRDLKSAISGTEKVMSSAPSP